MDKFYVYMWYDGDTPVYVGKGCGRRAFRNKEVEVKIVEEGLSETQALELEKDLIAQYGRADLEEGTLLNLTNGGGINFHDLYWEGAQLKRNHQRGIEKRNNNVSWQLNVRNNAKRAVEQRSSDWQDSLYLVKDPEGKVYKLKTQQLKSFCTERALDFNQLKHIARTRPVKRSSSRHYGYDVKCLYNKVTGERLEEQIIINNWKECE